MFKMGLFVLAVLGCALFAGAVAPVGAQVAHKEFGTHRHHHKPHRPQVYAPVPCPEVQDEFYTNDEGGDCYGGEAGEPLQNGGGD